MTAKSARFPLSPSARLAFGFTVFVALFAFIGPYWGGDPTQIRPDSPLLGPFQSPLHWFGTDDLGRDLLSRLAIGAQISLFIGLATAVVSVCLGTFYGAVAAIGESWLDAWMMRFTDILYSLPALMIVILLSVFLGRNVWSLVLALSLFSWPDTARLVRGQVLRLRQEEYVEAFHSLGGHWTRLLFRHIIPNTLGIIILSATITVPRAILTESTLSFIGLGVEPPLSSWGTLASEGWQLLRVAPHLLLFPALFIALTMISLNLLGDALRIHFDPKSTGH